MEQYSQFTEVHDDFRDKAKELFESVQKQIKETRGKLAKEMVEKGMSPDLYEIADNLPMVLEDFSIPYQCWPVLKTRMKRGNV